MSAVGSVRRVDEAPSQVAASTQNLSEPLFLERGIPSQVEWALARLSLYTQQLGDRFVLSEYPGLDESLVRLIRRLSLALQGASRETWDQDRSEITSSNFLIDQGIGAPGENGGANLALSCVEFSRPSLKSKDPDHFAPLSVKRDSILLKHAAAAALVLRNVTLSQANAVHLSFVPGILRILCKVTDALFNSGFTSELEIYADLRVNILDILEPLASRIQLSDWVRLTYGCVEETANDICSPTEGDQLFALLHKLLHTTNDRALLLASLRCLRAISTNEENAVQLVDATPQLELTRLKITSRCLALLPLTQDPELLEAAVDLLYQMVRTGDNALLLGSLRISDICDQGYAIGLSQRGFHEHNAKQDDLVSVPVTEYLARNLGLGKTVWERDSVMTKNTSAPWASTLLSPAELRLRKEHSKRTRKEQASPQERMRWKELTASELDQLKRLDEPLRGTEW
ncbi:hypothetical protein MYAM1_001800 [Malassezia yamatoensis]|uniref:Uncharacterized protein n=1 Tax=Malassezia yamatoensis TaxID=253288 RepID=A0AAJ5YRF5_9BASI|nr:hypothetical protein MYAM1_001800 [Malassezia yamatoensis]